MKKDNIDNKKKNDFKSLVLSDIERVLGEPNLIAFPREFVDYTGTLDCAILLSQLVYWSDRAKRRDGGVFKTYKDWKAELGLSEYEVKKSVQILKDKNILTTQLKKAHGSPTLHYYFNRTEFRKSFNGFLQKRKSELSIQEKLDNSNSSNLGTHAEETNDSLTDTTTENTTYITSERESSNDDNVSLSFNILDEEDKNKDEANTETSEIPDGEDTESLDDEETLYDLYWSRMELLQNQGISESAISIPNDFMPDDNMMFWARTTYPEKLIDKATEKFIDYFKGKKIKSCNWKEKWKKWIDDEKVVPEHKRTIEYRTFMQIQGIDFSDWWCGAFEDFVKHHCERTLISKQEFYEGFPHLTATTIDGALEGFRRSHFDEQSAPIFGKQLKEINGFYYSSDLYESWEYYRDLIDADIAKLAEST